MSSAWPQLWEPNFSPGHSLSSASFPVQLESKQIMYNPRQPTTFRPASTSATMLSSHALLFLPTAATHSSRCEQPDVQRLEPARVASHECLRRPEDPTNPRLLVTRTPPLPHGTHVQTIRSISQENTMSNV
eukprot:scaffold43081_cov75-Phaeocystis_antarctica.AAC.1